MLRRLIAAAAMGAAVAAPIAVAGPASANSGFYMVLNGTSLAITDAGHNNQVLMESESAYYTETGGAGGWFELKDQYGECLNAASNGNVYSDSCIGTTPEKFTKIGYAFENQHFGLYLAAFDARGTGVFLGNAPGSQWATPGA